MDDRRFDTLARSIGAIRSRRRVLAALTGAALAGTLSLEERGVTAAPKPADAKCSQDTQCASGTCIRYGKCKNNGRLTGKCRCACDNHADCGSGRNCRHRACFSSCSRAGTCDFDLEACGSGTCGCYASADGGLNCTFAGRNACQTAGCTTAADCPIGYICSAIQGSDLVSCCGGVKPRTCHAPCQAKSVRVA